MDCLPSNANKLWKDKHVLEKGLLQSKLSVNEVIFTLNLQINYRLILTDHIDDKVEFNQILNDKVPYMTHPTKALQPTTT